MRSHMLAHVALRALAAEAVAGALRDAGIRWAALKGLDLAYRAYPSPGDRDMCDLDVLVDPERLDDAARALSAAGLEEVASEAIHHRRFRWAVRGSPEASRFHVSVEVHRDLFDRPHGLSVDPSALLDRATSIDVPDGFALPVLSAADAWVHVAAHFAYSDAGGVSVRRALADLSHLSRACHPDEDEVLEVARAWGVDRSIGLVFGAVQEATSVEDPLVLRFVTRASGWSGPRGWLARRLLRRRIARTLAREDAAPGAPVTRGPRPAPASAIRSLLAPSLRSGLAIIREGTRRRRAASARAHT